MRGSMLFAGLPLPVAQFAYRLPGPKNPHWLTGPELSYRLPGWNDLTAYLDISTHFPDMFPTFPGHFPDTFLETFERLAGSPLL